MTKITNIVLKGTDTVVGIRVVTDEKAFVIPVADVRINRKRLNLLRRLLTSIVEVSFLSHLILAKVTATTYQ